MPAVAVAGRFHDRFHGISHALAQGFSASRHANLTQVAARPRRVQTNRTQDLPSSLHAADAKLRRLLQRIDRYVAANPALDGTGPAQQPTPIDVSAMRSTSSLDLAAEGITTVIWATGFRRDYSWLRVPVLDARAEIIHARGVTPAAGLYAMGLRFQHTRKSSFIDGVAKDAEYIARQIAARLGMRESDAA